MHILETGDFSFTYKGETYTIPKHFERHDKLNAAAAATAAICLGLYMNNIRQGLLNFIPMPMRLERFVKNGVRFILDCYNANPASMKNALEVLGREPNSPRIAVLGDMKELGKDSSFYHREVAQQILDNKIDTVFLAGPEMRHAYELLKTAPGVKAHYAQAPAAWIPGLKKVLNAGGSCLIKASHSMHFENIFKEI